MLAENIERPKRLRRDPPAGERRSVQSMFLLVSFIASLLLVAGLAWQAIATARSQYETSRQLLEDYAAVAAEELMRRSTVEVGYYGAHVLMAELDRHIGSSVADVPAPDELARSGDEALRRAVGLAEAFFRRSPQGEIVTRPDQDFARIIERLPAVAASTDSPFRAMHVKADDARDYRVVAATNDRAGTYGFVLRPQALGEWFDRAMSRGALVPKALGGGAIANDRLDVRVVDAHGNELFARGTLREPNVERRFGEDYGGLFEGAWVRLGVDPAIARQLVVGGVSPMRVLGLLGLLAATVALIIATSLQVRRERELLRLRTDFVSRVSHELRTPLAQIRLFAETLLLDRARTAEERERCLQIVQREAIRLGHLVDNVLLFSRREQAPNLAAGPRRLAPLVADIVEEFHPAAREELDLRLELEQECEVAMHPGALRQILLNLLDNAVKYGAPPITVRVLPVDGFVRLSVEDCGPGVPDTDKDRAWDEFFRLERDIRSAKAGTGIGLAVVRELVLGQGGRCLIEDGATGGARIVVDLRR